MLQYGNFKKKWKVFDEINRIEPHGSILLFMLLVIKIIQISFVHYLNVMPLEDNSIKTMEHLKMKLVTNF